MDISELIIKLIAVQKRHGDLKVGYWNSSQCQHLGIEKVELQDSMFISSLNNKTSAEEEPFVGLE